MKSAIQSLVVGLVFGLGATLASACSDGCGDCGPSEVQLGTFKYEWQTENPDFPDMSGGEATVSDGKVRWEYGDNVVEFIRVSEGAGGAGGAE